MPDYNQGKIYKLGTLLSDDIYIGSTCGDLFKRLRKHQCSYRLYLQGKARWISSFSVIEQGMVYIELLENVNANDKLGLLTRENHYINELHPVNKYRAGAVLLAGGRVAYKRQHHMENREENNRKSLEYYRNHKERLQRKYPCPCGGRYTYQHKEAHKKTYSHIKYLLALHNELNHLANL